MYVKKKKKIKTDFFFSKPIMEKCLNIGKNIGNPIYRSISNLDPLPLRSVKYAENTTGRGEQHTI